MPKSSIPLSQCSGLADRDGSSAKVLVLPLVSRRVSRLHSVQLSHWQWLRIMFMADKALLCAAGPELDRTKGLAPQPHGPLWVADPEEHVTSKIP